MAETRERVRRLSGRLERLIAVLAAAVLLAALAGMWLAVSNPAWLVSFIGAQWSLPVPAVPSGPVRGLLAVALLLQAGLLVWALASLRRAFAEVSRGDLFGTAAAHHLRRAGALFMVNAAAMLLGRPVVALILSIDMPPGERFISIGVGTPELLVLLLSGVVTVFGHLMAVAAEVDDENRRFV